MAIARKVNRSCHSTTAVTRNGPNRPTVLIMGQRMSEDAGTPPAEGGGDQGQLVASGRVSPGPIGLLAR